MKFKAVLLEASALRPVPNSVAQVGFQLLRTAAPNREPKISQKCELAPYIRVQRA